MEQMYIAIWFFFIRKRTVLTLENLGGNIADRPTDGTSFATYFGCQMRIFSMIA